MTLLLATLAAYLLPAAFPDPSLAFYIARGWLGCLWAWALWRGWRLSAHAALVIALWESSAAVCGSMWAGIVGASVKPLCDQTSGLPVTLPALAVTLLVVVHLACARRGRDG